MRACPQCRTVFVGQPTKCPIDGSSLDDARDPLAGLTLGRYTLHEELGKGAMGLVYRASAGDERFAIKVLYGELAADEKLAKRFRREGEVAMSMRHVNLVPVSDVGTTEVGVPYLAMELVQGVTMQEALKVEAPFPPARTVRIARQLAEGLAHAHGKTVVHRDLKPANIILDVSSGTEVVKILDFGLAAIADAEGARTKLTETGQTMGSPMYMGPEQFRTAAVGPTADLYALGVMIYEMITGKPPFVGNIAAVAFAKVNGEFEDAPETGGLGPLAKRLMHPQPEHRPQTAEAVLEALEEVEVEADDDAAVAPVPDAAAPTPEAAPANSPKLGLWLAGAVVVLLAIAALVLTSR